MGRAGPPPYTFSPLGKAGGLACALADMTLHETAVSWVRKRLAVTTPKKKWLETREEYSTRLKRCCDKVNAECDVEGLCRQYPKRLKLLKDKEGGRLKC